MPEMTDKIRTLTNKVHLAGILAELDEIYEGTTTAGVPYVSFRGAIQCGETPNCTVKFRSFVKSKKSDGTDSKIFKKVKDWAYGAIPMTKDVENATKVDLVGSISDNPYVSSDGKLVEATQFNMQLINDFKGYAAEVDIEGFIHTISDEKKNDEETGRQLMRLISRDIFGNTLDIKNLVVPTDLVDALEENDYNRGKTATFYVNLVPNEAPAKAKTGGIGVQRVEGRSYLEWIITGADPVIDEDSERALDAKVVKTAMAERKAHLDEVNQAGYRGNKTSSSNTATTNTRASGIGTKPAAKANQGFTPIDDDMDDDLPF